MTIVTDNVQVKNGTDFTFICGKVPFAITCSSRLQHGNYNLIDMDLVNKMKIPIQKIKVCRMTYLGENLRSVGYIDQTVQCVNNGVVQGTVHLSAKVIRNLFENFNVDCIASSKTFERLVGVKPPDPPDSMDEGDDDDEQHEKAAKYKGNPDEYRTKMKQMEAARKRLHSRPSSRSCSSSSSEEYHSPINKEWLFKASFIAETAQRDHPDVLLEIEDEIADPNYKAKDEDDSSSSSDEDDDDSNAKPDAEKVFAKTDDDDEDDERDEKHCNLCFYEGKPIKIVTNHNEGCPTCPTMTPEQKFELIGPDWKIRAERMFQKRFQRQAGGRRSYART